MSANATSQLTHVFTLKSTTLICALVFAPQRTVEQTNSGSKSFANVSANQKSALRVNTGGLTLRTQTTVAAFANINHVKLTTIGMKKTAIAFAPQGLAM